MGKPKKAWQPTREFTPMQRETLLSLAHYLERHGRAPSLSELAELMGLTKAGAQRHMRELRAKGWVKPAVATVAGGGLTPAGKKMHRVACAT